MVYSWTRHHAAYNRETIDISNYNDVSVSVYYSYKSTESSDEFGLYYYDSGSWIAIYENFNPSIGSGNQLTWTLAQGNIPNDIDNLILSFWWSTSESREYVMIDDLTVTGKPAQVNFSGNIDEFAIYDRALSEEQIYQNYLCKKDGDYTQSIIVSEETNVNEEWKCIATPNNGIVDDTSVTSNTVQIQSCGGGT